MRQSSRAYAWPLPQDVYAFARKAVAEEKIIRREAVIHELTQAELSVSRVISLVAGAPQ